MDSLITEGLARPSNTLRAPWPLDHPSVFTRVFLRMRGHMNMKEVTAQLNRFRMSPRKVRLLTSLIKGMAVPSALVELERRPGRAAGPLVKLLKSALANASHNAKIDTNDLYVKDIYVNEGAMFKRSRPRAFGRAAMIRKRTSCISLVLGTKEESKVKS